MEIGEALKRFVEKDERSALSDAYNKILKDTQEAALDDLGKSVALEGQEAVAAEGAAEGDEAAERQVIDAVHAAGQRLQAEAIAKFAEADVRLRLAEEEIGREDAAAEGDEYIGHNGVPSVRVMCGVAGLSSSGIAHAAVGDTEAFVCNRPVSVRPHHL